MRERPSSVLMAPLLAAWLLTPTAAAAYTVYVTNEKDNTVSIIDSTKLEVVKTVKVGQRPRGIILSKDGKWLLICATHNLLKLHRHRLSAATA